MIQISKVKVLGWDVAIRGMRNPLNSWDKSDSKWNNGHRTYDIGANDLKLMTNLANAGSDHAKYRRMITVYADIVAPLYWWKEYDTYKVGTVANSCSTMHKIHSKEFTLDDFSIDCIGLSGIKDETYIDGECRLIDWALDTIDKLEQLRLKYIETGDKKYWRGLIQLLPSSYNQKRTVQLNYEVLANIYKSRKNHKLDEWRDFCNWVESLPYSEIITG